MLPWGGGGGGGNSENRKGWLKVAHCAYVKQENLV